MKITIPIKYLSDFTIFCTAINLVGMIITHTFRISISGAFLIPFMTMLILEGIPLFLIELGMGQKMRLGSLGVWNTSKLNVIYLNLWNFCNVFKLNEVHPWLGGIGISSCIVTLFVALYYNVIITWCVYYLINSFRVSQFNNKICLKL